MAARKAPKPRPRRQPDTAPGNKITQESNNVAQEPGAGEINDLLGKLARLTGGRPKIHPNPLTANRIKALRSSKLKSEP